MREVLGRAIATMATGFARAGIPTDRALGRIPFPPSTLASPLCRVDWDHFTLFLDDLLEDSGGPEAFEAAGERAYPEMISVVYPFLGLLVSPRALYAFVHTWGLPMSYRIVRTTERDLPGGRLAVAIEIPAPYRPCPGFFYATAGAMRSAPHFIGARSSRVVADIEPRVGRYVITMPPSRTIAAQLRRANAEPAVDALFAALASSWGEILERLDDVDAKERSHRELTSRLREALAARAHTDRVLRSVLDSLSGSLFTIDADGTVTALDGAGRDALSRDGATLAPRIVSVARGGADDRLVRIRGDSTTAYVMLVSPEDAFEGRIARCAEAWQLTPRQIEVVSMAVRGLANKEIAAQLGCAPHTIELHMSEALRRAKVDGRAALVAAFWSGAALPAAKRPGVE